jgi:arylsulfatase A-like enzyme
MARTTALKCYPAILLTVWLSTSVCLVASVGAEESNSRPNVIVILTDDQGWGDFSLHGNRNLETPNLDALAKSGAQFERFFVCPVCSPTRAEFLTGRYATRGGVYSTSAGGERLNLDAPTIADAFGSAGYQTAAFGKWHNGGQYPYHPCGRGFESFYGFCSGHWGNYFSPMLEENGKVVRGDGFLPDDLTNRAIRVLQRHAATEDADPVFLYLAYNTPHSPMQVPDRFYQRFANRELIDRGSVPENENIAHTRAALAMCENIDWNVGRLLEELDDLSIAQNTIVVFFCDNGPNGHRFNGQMRGTKGSTDEGGVRSPLFVRWPQRVEPGKTVRSIAGAIDLLPTLTDLAGVDFEPTRKLDGISLAALLLKKPAMQQGGGAGETVQGETAQDRNLFSFWNGRLSVRSQNFRLDEKGRLYHMTDDPSQSKQVNDRFPDVARELTAAGANWLKETNPIALAKADRRPFTIGHHDFAYSHLPARDAEAMTNGSNKPALSRSNKYPNDSYFLNWKSTNDSLVWPVEVLDSGEFEATIYYACDESDVGCSMALVADDGIGGSTLSFKINESHDVPELGREADRVVRQESYVKDFKALVIGNVALKKGSGTLSLRVEKIVGKEAIEFRLLMLKRIEN